MLESLQQTRPSIFERDPAIAATLELTRDNSVVAWIAGLEVFAQLTGQPFGGVRLWFTCECGRRCGVLYRCEPGWRCRWCTGRRYASQGHGAIDRMRSKAFALYDRVNINYRVWPRQIGPKPRWMRWRTYSRIRMQAEALDSAAIIATYRASRVYATQSPR